MDVLITVVMLSSIIVCLLIICDYLHRMAGMTYRRIAAITFPVWLILIAMLILSITYKG